MKWILPGLLALFLPAANAENIPIEGWTSTLRPAYMDVPAYQTYKNVRLHLQVRPPEGQPVQAELRMDGRRLALTTLKPNLTFDLPDLAPGGHVLRLHTLGPVAANECAALGQDLAVMSAQLEFAAEQHGAPKLSQLPEGLYQPRLNSVVVGQIESGQWNNRTMQVALQLSQLFTGTRPIVWQSNLNPALPADFKIVMLARPDLKSPARLELQPGQLRVLYRQEDDLSAAIRTLAQSKLLARLQSASANIQQAAALPAASIALPQTLQELGLNDYRVWGGQAPNEQALKLPPLWEPNGPVSGQLHYFLPPPISGREKVNLRIGGRGSELTGTPVASGGFQARFDGDSPEPGQALAFAVSASDLTRCEASMRVAGDSTIDFHPRSRTGLTTLPRLLIREPSISLPYLAGDIDLALNIAASLQHWGLRGLLPWEVHFDQPQQTATLRLAHTEQATEQTTVRLQTGLFAKPQVLLTTLTPTAAQALGSYWQRVPAQLSDRLTDINIQSGGNVTSAKSSHNISSAAIAHPSLLLILGFSFLALPVMGLIWWLQRRKA